MRRDGKSQPNVHPGGIALNRCIEEFLDFRESHDLVEFTADLCARHAEDRSVQINIFTPSQLGMEASSNLEEAGNATSDHNPAHARFGDSRQHLQQSCFPGPIAANDAPDLSA